MLRSGEASKPTLHSNQHSRMWLFRRCAVLSCVTPVTQIQTESLCWYTYEPLPKNGNTHFESVNFFSVFHVFHEGCSRVKCGNWALRLAAESTLPKYNYCKTINELLLSD